MIYPRNGAVKANDNLIIKLLNDSTVALLSDVVLIFIRFLKCGVIIPLNKYTNAIKNKPNSEILKPKHINDIDIYIDI